MALNLSPVVDIGDIARKLFFAGRDKVSGRDIKQIEKLQHKYNADMEKLLGVGIEQVRSELHNVNDLENLLRQTFLQNKYNSKKFIELGKQEQKLLNAKINRVKKQINSINELDDEILEIQVDKEISGDAKTGKLMSTLNKIKGFFDSDPTIGASAYVAKVVGFYGGATILKTALDNMSSLSAKTQEAGYWASKLMDDFNKFTKYDPKNLTTDIEAFTTLLDMRRNFGTSLELDRKTLDSIANYANTMGIAREEAMTMFKALEGINGQTVEFNNQYIQSMFILSDKYKVSFKDVMGDITQNAEYFATYMSNSDESIKKLVIGLRTAGIEFGTVSKILSTFTDVETTISKQMKLGMFTGQSFDFLGVAQKQFDGDIQGATKSIIDQIRGVSEENMNSPFLRKQLAEALGLSVSELAQLYRRSKNKDIDSVETNYQESIDALNKNINSLGFTKLKTTFVQSILTPLANFVSENTKAIQSFFDGVGFIIKIIGGISSQVLKAVNWVDDLLGDTGWITSMVLTISSAMAGIKLFNYMQLKANGTSLEMLFSMKRIESLVTKISMGMGIHGPNLPNNSSRGMGNGMKNAMKYGGGLLSALPAVMNLANDENVTALDYLTNTASGALSGFMLGGPWGALIGGVAGLGATGIKDLRQMNQGGILVNSPVAMGNKILGDGQNGTQSEAVIPLNSDRGKQMMEINLSDSSIDKLLTGMKAMNIPINIVINNDTDKDKQQFRQLANYSSNLSFG